MTTINDLEPDIVPCPMCGTPIEFERLGLKGLSGETMSAINGWIKNGTVSENVEAVKMMQRRTEESGRDLANKEAIREEINPVNETLKKLVEEQKALSQAFIPRKGDYAE